MGLSTRILLPSGLTVADACTPIAEASLSPLNSLHQPNAGVLEVTESTAGKPLDELRIELEGHLRAIRAGIVWAEQQGFLGCALELRWGLEQLEDESRTLLESAPEQQVQFVSKP